MQRTNVFKEENKVNVNHRWQKHFQCSNIRDIEEFSSRRI